MADSGGIDEEHEVELVDQTLVELFRQHMFYPWLYSPIEALDSFLWDNRHLFTLIGVFGAVAVYLKSVESEISGDIGNIGDFAVVSGLGIVVLLSVVVGIKLWLRVREVGIWESAGLIGFGALFGSLVLVITGLISSFSETVAVYIFFIVYSLGLVTGLLGGTALARVSAAADSRLGLDTPLISLALHTAAVLILSYIYQTTSYLDEPLAPALEATPTLGDWFEIYMAFALAFLGLIVFGVFLIVVLLTIAGAIANIIQRIALLARGPLDALR